jgi:hypothetical protein
MLLITVRVLCPCRVRNRVAYTHQNDEYFASRMLACTAGDSTDSLHRHNSHNGGRREGANVQHQVTRVSRELTNLH